MVAGNHQLVPIPNVRLVATRLMMLVVFKLRPSRANECGIGDQIRKKIYLVAETSHHGFLTVKKSR
jgi:hypothetical protein